MKRILTKNDFQEELVKCAQAITADEPYMATNAGHFNPGKENESQPGGR